MSNILNLETPPDAQDSIADRVERLVRTMTIEEKVGQLQQVDASGPVVSEDLKAAVRSGRIGSVINQTDRSVVAELQRIAIEESRLGVPLLIGRDVIHGFRTIMPIPLGQAASWNPDLVRRCAAASAVEAAAAGVNWTFAPMIDIARDARWGRIAESFGEDPYLTSVFGVAIIEGLQGARLDGAFSIAACAKHFAGYGAAESGRDYNTTNIPENELRNVYFPPFRAACEAGAATFMCSFGDLDGVPASANTFLMKDVLRTEWGFEGFVVSDWDSIRQLTVHGIAADHREAALLAATAGVDMEMAGDSYATHLPALVLDGDLDAAQLDVMVANVLRLKAKLGLFENPMKGAQDGVPRERALEIAHQAATESIVLLRNANAALPLDRSQISSVAVIGPMADAPYEQLGTWIFDGDESLSVTPLAALRDYLEPEIAVRFAPAMPTTRSRSEVGFAAALQAAERSDVVLVFLGEESILSGEAHSRADIDLPGNQMDLIRALEFAGKPIIAVVMAGRPLTIGGLLKHADAVLYAWHPGAMGGPALRDILFGAVSPSGRLPVSFPKMVGQIPIYYNHKNTGRPPSHETTLHIDDIEPGAKQTSFGMTAFHLDAGFEPLFPFGFGLSYAAFRYSDLTLSAQTLTAEETLVAEISVANVGDVEAEETVQLYVRDLVGSLTRPVKELKDFRKVRLRPGETVRVRFALQMSKLAFFGREKRWRVEPGAFQLWIGPNSQSGETALFEVART